MDGNRADLNPIPTGWELIPSTGFVVLVSGILIITFLNSRGTNDVVFWLEWMSTIRHNGLINGYLEANLQPPFGFVILAILVTIADWTGVPDFVALKGGIGFAVFLSIVASAHWRHKWEAELGLITLFVLILNSVLLSYLDVFMLFFIVMAICSFQRGRFDVGTAMFTTACLVKWQANILAPFVAVYLWPTAQTVGGYPALLTYFRRVWPAPVLISVAVTIFGAETILNSFLAIIENNFLSGNALNINWLLTAYLRMFAGFGLIDGQVEFLYLSQVHDYIWWTYIFKTLMFVGLVSSLIVLARSRHSLLDFIETAIVGYFCYFTLNTGVHENHLMPAAMLSVFWTAIVPSRRIQAILIILIANTNQLVFYGLNGTGLGFSRVVGWDTTIYLALFNVLVFIIWFPIGLSSCKKRSAFEFDPSNDRGGIGV